TILKKMESKSFKHPGHQHTIMHNERDVDTQPGRQGNIDQLTDTSDNKEPAQPVNIRSEEGNETNVATGPKHQPDNGTEAPEPTGNSKTIFDPEIVQRMKKIISSYTENHEELESITSETNINFIERLNIDSVDVVEIIIDTE